VLARRLARAERGSEPMWNHDRARHGEGESESGH
jgi:hypothetical protein